MPSRKITSDSAKRKHNGDRKDQNREKQNTGNEGIKNRIRDQPEQYKIRSSVEITALINYGKGEGFWWC